MSASNFLLTSLLDVLFYDSLSSKGVRPGNGTEEVVNSEEGKTRVPTKLFVLLEVE